MNALTIILIVIAGLIALILIVALFARKKYTIEREIIIKKPKQVVFDYIRLLKNQDNFSKWAKMDPEMKREYRGTDGNVGFVSAWESEQKQVGKGEQTIKSIRDGESVYYDLHFIKPYDAKALALMAIHPISDNQTKVTWSFSGDMKYPMNIMLLNTKMEKMIGDDLLTGLKNLKTILES